MTAERPPLPTRHANPFLQSDELNPSVKYQVLSCQGQDILVGRLKIPTPTSNSTRSLAQSSQSGHAFILRRFDTDAISLTTMFRAAFPTASEDDEKREVSYIRASHDLSGNNGSARDTHITRLAGTWVGKSLAKSLAREYGLASLVDLVCDAAPDSNANYRRSGKSTTNTSQTSVTSSPHVPPSAAQQPATASPAAKRRKESPAPSIHSSPAPKVAPTPFAIAGASPTPRKSTRGTRSPAPARSTPAKTPKKEALVKPPSSSSKSSKLERPSSPDTIVNADLRTKDHVADETAVLDVASEELHKQDIEEQKDMIAKLKAQRDSAQDVTMQEPISKRSREETDQGLTFEFAEHPEGQEVVKKEDRPVVTNKRVKNRFQQLEPRQKSFAWGVAAFAVGMSAVHFLPDLINQYLPL